MNACRMASIEASLVLAVLCQRGVAPEGDGGQTQS
jgi:hypothetical protein